ncbi:lipoprotein insertase outer membrane protein LolB [Ideonella sp.]|jgi:outer membrane lipoprotein LolB|uniref:lipoprotein insertase outer membrane protein LolB n=1 Tax=Ideonella sp. TaxID=1929293 RepID=UPI0037C0AAA8
MSGGTWCRLAAAFCLALSLSACVTAPPRAPDAAPALQGRMALRVAESPSGPAQSVSASFELSGHEHHGELRLFSPLGTVLALAQWSPQGVTLDSGQGPQAYANLDELSRSALGESVPLAALPSWLKGQPWPGADVQWQVPAGDAGGPRFWQADWLVDASRLEAEGWVEARREQPPAVRLRIRLDR